MKKATLFLVLFALFACISTIHAANTECAGIETTHDQGDPFDAGYEYTFTTTGTDVTITFELLDAKDGVVAFFWNKTTGFLETQMTLVEGKKFSLTLPSQEIGAELTVACKFAYAGGMSVTKDLKYTVGNRCSSEEDPDVEAPQNLTASAGTIAYNSIELLLNATDDSGVVIYEISYNGITKTTTGASGVAKTYKVTGLSANTAYEFSIVAKDAAGNVSSDSPVLVNATTVENLNTECLGITTDVDQGDALVDGCKYEFKTIGTDVVVTFELLDAKVGLVAFLWDKTVAFREVAMTHDSGQKYTYTLEGQTPGGEITVACKFAYAGGMTIIKDLKYTVGEDCTGGGGEEDVEIPTAFTVSLGDVTYSSAQFILNGADNSGVVIYEITYGDITKTVSGVSGVERVYTLPDLLSGKSYQFSIVAKDVAGNVAANSPVVIDVTTLKRTNDCRGNKGHFGTPLNEKISYDISTLANGDVLVKLSPIDASRKIEFAELQSTKGNFSFTVSEDGSLATSTITGLATDEEIGIRFLYRLDDMPGNEMTSETVLLSDPNIIYYLVGDNCGYTSIDESQRGNTSIIYPNPVVNELTVKSEAGVERIMIYSSLGQLVGQYEIKGQREVTLNVGRLVPSTYVLIVIHSDGSKSNHKIIKQ